LQKLESKTTLFASVVSQEFSGFAQTASNQEVETNPLSPSQIFQGDLKKNPLFNSSSGTGHPEGL